MTALTRTHAHTDMGRDSVVGVATRYGWTVRGLDTGRNAYSAPVQPGPVAHVVLYRYRAILRGKAAGSWC